MEPLATGYKVVRVPFKDGRPEGYYENFATGFWVSSEERAEVWGRPAALAVAKDGALLVADDTGDTPSTPPGRRRGRRRKSRLRGAESRAPNRAARGLPRLVPRLHGSAHLC